MAANPVVALHPGASQLEWAHFDLVLGLTADLLPVVSNLRAVVSPKSNLKGLGKTPSVYNAQRQVVGLPNWTRLRATPVQILRWQADRDYGMCLQTRVVRAIDVDIPDPEQAQRVAQLVTDLLGVALPKRVRANSGKLLLAFGLRGDYSKRVIRTAHGAIEFLANGQQFVACGTHSSGVRYEWEGGLPDEFPVVSDARFEALWVALDGEFAIEPGGMAPASVKAQKLADVHERDPVARHLLDHGHVLKTERDGRLHIKCPYTDEHTTDTGESATTYWPAHTGGYALGHFRCLHAHCEQRTDEDFLAGVGYGPEDEFEAIADTEIAESGTPGAMGGGLYFDYGVDAVHPVEYVIDGFLPTGVTAIAGAPGKGKTSSLVPLAAAAAHLYDTPLRPVLRRRVVYLSEHPEQVQTVLYGLAKHAPGARREEFMEWFRIVPAKRRKPGQLRGLVRKLVEEHTVWHESGYRVTPLIVMDTASANIDLDEENNNSQIGAAIAAIREGLGGGTCWIVHHTPKAQGSAPLEDLTLRGGGAWEGDASCTAFIGDEGASDRRFMRLGKRRFEAAFAELEFDTHVDREIVETPWGEPQEVVYRYGFPKASSAAERQVKATEARVEREADKDRAREALVLADLRENGESTIRAANDRLGGGKRLDGWVYKAYERLTSSRQIMPVGSTRQGAVIFGVPAEGG